MSRIYDAVDTLAHKGRITNLSPSSTRQPLIRNKAMSFRASPPEWMNLLVAFHRHWRLGLAFLIVVVAVTAALTFLSKPIYQPTAKIEVDPPGMEVFSLQSASAGSTDLDRIIETQAQILNSDEIAIKAIRELRLDKNAEVVGRLAATAPQGGTQQLSAAEGRALANLRKHLRARPIKNSQTIQISFESHNAELSRDVVNRVLQLYLNKHHQTRFDAVTQSSEWLSRQLLDIRNKAEESGRALSEYQKSHNIADVSEEQSTLTLRVSELSRQLTQAGADRIQLEAFNRAIQEGKGDSLPQVRESPVIQNLVTSIAKDQSELAQTQVIYGQNHPNVQRLKNATAALETQLARERSSILEGINTSYVAASAREQMLNRQLRAATAGIGAMGEYVVLKHEAQANSDLYNTLYGRIKEAGISAASKSSNIRVLEEARLLDKPTRPVPLTNMTLALVFGVIGAFLTMFLRDRLDMTLRTPEEIPELATLPAITFIPPLPEARHLLRPASAGLLRESVPPPVVPFVIDAPGGNAAEAVRTLVSSLLNQQPTPRVMLVSSALPREGKTTIAVNLALAFSELDETCILDADLRRPAVASALHVPSEPGFETLLKSDADFSTVLRPCPRAPRLQIAPAGRSDFNPGALLMSSALNEVMIQLRERFRYIVIDAPPILSYADARALAPFTDGIVIVARYGQTGKIGIERAMRVVDDLHVAVLGFVLNGVDTAGDYGYYGYYGYRPEKLQA